MSNEEANHEKQFRFSARHRVTSVGATCGEACAVASAKGLIRGAVDELRTMRGDREAFEFLNEMADEIMKREGGIAWLKTAEQLRGQQDKT